MSPVSTRRRGDDLDGWGGFFILMSVVLVPVTAITEPFILTGPRAHATAATLFAAGLIVLTLLTVALALGSWFDPSIDRRRGES